MLKLLKARLYSENFLLRRFSRELSAIPDRLQNVVPTVQLVNDLRGNVRPVANQRLASWGSFWKKRGLETQSRVDASGTRETSKRRDENFRWEVRTVFIGRLDFNI
jgi:hypothetical protein